MDHVVRMYAHIDSGDAKDAIVDSSVCVDVLSRNQLSDCSLQIENDV